ncbi:MAG: hypothetical protein U0946_01325, partial [Patescibacteria group bacterium]|nr:hypothetical protein [Patescibacteria group bacterium]
MSFSTRVLHWFYKLSWKKIIGFSLFLLIVVAVPLSIKIANNQTRTKSQATLVQPSAQPVTTQFETPQGP